MRIAVFAGVKTAEGVHKEVAAGLIKLKPDSKSKVDECRDTMKRRMEEALATLVHEGAEFESWFRINTTMI
jgi:hypothetical protein